MRLVSTYLIGLIFGVGIAISGMANPAKVLNFFDVAGSWDPSLAFVMGGAVVVAFIAPIIDSKFHLPDNPHLDARLLGGSALFGVGWGIAGFCPGGALPALGTGRIEVLAFVAALIAGVFAAKGLMALTHSRAARLLRRES
jgi:uncharacterized membrane protein YedE/YeeE